MLTTIVLLTALCRQEGREPTADAPEPVSASLEMIGDLPVVEVVVDGTRAAKMILDTGSTLTWFRPGFFPGREGQAKISIGDASVMLAYRSRSLGTVSLANLRRGKPHVAGVLGMDFLSQFKVGVDLRNSVLALWKGTERLPNLVKFFSAKTYVPNLKSPVRWIDPGATITVLADPPLKDWRLKGAPATKAPYYLPISRTFGSPTLEIDVAGRKTLAVLDTGSEVSLLMKTHGTRTTSEPTEPPFVIVMGWDSLKAVGWTAPMISAGGHPLSYNEPVFVTETPPYGMELLGVPLLRGGRWLFDFQGEAALFFPPG